MTIQEAINSGKLFKRRGWTEWHEKRPMHIWNVHPNANCIVEIRPEDILANDWEIKTEELLTETEICEKFRRIKTADEDTKNHITQFTGGALQAMYNITINDKSTYKLNKSPDWFGEGHNSIMKIFLGESK